MHFNRAEELHVASSFTKFEADEKKAKTSLRGRDIQLQENNTEVRDTFIVALFFLLAAGAWFTLFTLMGRAEHNPRGFIIGVVGASALFALGLMVGAKGVEKGLRKNSEKENS